MDQELIDRLKVPGFDAKWHVVSGSSFLDKILQLAFLPASFSRIFLRLTAKSPLVSVS
jgi:hypothetical protein